MATSKEVDQVLARAGLNIHDNPESLADDEEVWTMDFDVEDVDQLVYRLNRILNKLEATEDQNIKLITKNLELLIQVDALEIRVRDLESENSVNGYQDKAMRTYKPTANLDGKDAILLGALGLAGEAGEVVEMVKKHVFHGKPLDMDALVKELGDVLWYLAVMARTVPNVSLGTVARLNIAKLLARYPEGFDQSKANNRKPEDK